MIYIQLPKKDGFNKIAIKEFHFLENYIIFKYFQFREENGSIIEGQPVSIEVYDKGKVEKIKSVSGKNLNCFDAFCRGLLQYLIDEEIQTGTLEVK